VESLGQTDESVDLHARLLAIHPDPFNACHHLVAESQKDQQRLIRGRVSCMALLADIPPTSQITCLKAGVLGDSRQHPGANLLSIMECKKYSLGSLHVQGSCEILTVA